MTEYANGSLAKEKDKKNLFLSLFLGIILLTYLAQFIGMIIYSFKSGFSDINPFAVEDFEIRYGLYCIL